MDDELRYRAVHARDSRFDGWFVTAVLTTGIYCRPSCPARTPNRGNVRFYRSAAAAQAGGFRACRRCRPDASPGSPEWNLRADVAGRAMRMIVDGLVDREGVAGLAARLGYSERQVNRVLVAELGAGPAALARSGRAQTARILLETTDLPITEVAFAAGFASIRSFNDTMPAVFALSPTELRRRARTGRNVVRAGTITLRLPYRAPADLDAAGRFLAARTVGGVEEIVAGSGLYRRALRLPHGPGVVELFPGDGFVLATLHLADLRNLAPAVSRCRRVFDLDADPVAVDSHLGADPLLAPLVAAAPGLRVPGAFDGAELAVRALLGQQVSVAAARTLAGRLTARYGEALADPVGAVTHLFPSAERLAALDPAELPMPAARGRALVTLAAALASGAVRLDPGADRDEVERALVALPGVGPWTAGYIRMRALGDPDVLLPTDLGVRRGIVQAGSDDDRPAAVLQRAEPWRPWRSYAVMHLWKNRSEPELRSSHVDPRDARPDRDPARSGPDGRTVGQPGRRVRAVHDRALADRRTAAHPQ